MRDLLTVLAGLVILVLLAALAVPPFIDWGSQRTYVDAALSRATGLAVRTEGAVDLRFLPTPRLSVARLRIGANTANDASLDARSVDAEIALTPLLSGEVRFLESRVRRLELKLPAGTAGDWRIPRTLMSEESLGRAWVFEDLAVAQLLLTTVDPATGRTDQAFAEDVRLQSQSMAGPWRAEGRTGGTRFTVATGEIALAGPTNVKISTDSDRQPRLNLDARMLLERGSGDVYLPRFDGSLRLVASREVAPIPYTATASFKTEGAIATLDTIAIEAGEGGPALRLTGGGEFSLDSARLAIALEGRRLDLDGLLAAVRQAPDETRRGWPLPVGFPVALTLKLDGVALAGEELAGASLRAELQGSRIAVERLEFTAPGQTRVAASGEVSLAGEAGGSGRVSLSTRSADRLASFLARLGIADISADTLAGRPLELSGDIVAAHPVASLRNLQVRLGDAALTGLLRYAAAEAGTRARVDAQLGIQGLDLDALPEMAGLFDAGRSIDLGLILDARNVGYGAGERGGRISARLASEGKGLTIDLLEIIDLAGANASLRGRIAPDGAGRIDGRLRARRAAPLIDLVGRAALGGTAELIPPFLRDGPLDVAVSATRQAVVPGADTSLVTRLSGTAGGGSLEAEIVSSPAGVGDLGATLVTADAGSWFGTPGIGRPAKLEVKGQRQAAGRLAVNVRADVAGLRIATSEPFTLSPRDDGLESGEATLVSADIGPLMPVLGQRVSGPVGVDLKARLGRRDGTPRIQFTGRVAGGTIEADVSGASPRDVSGRVVLGRVSLPWIASMLALGAIPDAPTGSAWPTGRFPAQPSLGLGGTVSVRAGTVELGRGLVGQDAEFTLATTADGFTIRDLSAGFLDGRLAGTLNLNRQGGLAAVIGDGRVSGLSLAALLGRPFEAGRLSGTLRFGGSGESVAGIIGNLGGAGSVEVEDVRVTAADPDGVARIVSRALRSDDTLAPARLQAFAAEELDRAPLRSAKATGQATFVSGGLRVSPIVADAGSAAWQGSAAVDMRNLSLDMRGSMTAKALPRNWTGPAPYLTLGWAGPIGRPTRTVDVGPLSNGLASVVLTRELERIEIFELDAAERARINARVEMDRARRAAAEEAARLARQREEAERARQEAERLRQEAERARREAEQILGVSRPPEGPPARGVSPLPPVDIRPPAQAGAP